MKYLDLTAEQAADLAAGKVVEVWERMEPQPKPMPHGFYQIEGGYTPHSKSGKIGFFFPSLFQAPHLPGTRARVRHQWDGGDDSRCLLCSDKDWRAGDCLPVVSTTTRPEQRDGAWGFVTTWAKEAR